MRRFIAGLGSVVMLLLCATAAQAQATKSASGTITEIAPDAVTVTVAGKEMKFAIDAKTEVISRGAGTKSRAAEAQGKGVGVMDVLKVGQNVEIRYHEEGMRAVTIRTIATVQSPAGPKSQTAAGMVSAVSGNSLTIKGSGGDMTFTIDEKTTVVGQGVGTASKKLQEEGKKPTITELVHDGDTVSVTYHDVAGTKQASVVRITKRKM